MGDMDHKPIKPAPDQTGDTLEHMLDAALAKYVAVEPRAGLEERVLANLRSERSQAPNRARWQWSLVAGLAAVTVVAITLLWRIQTPVPPVVSIKPTVTKSARVNSTPQVAGQSSGPIEPAKPRHTGQEHRITAVVAVAPKLEQFPSPQPLSPEEIALAQYVRNFPKEAQLVAQAQEDFELETQKELNAGSQTGTPGSIQQEQER